MICKSRQERRQLERDIDKLTPSQARLLVAMAKEEAEKEIGERLAEFGTVQARRIEEAMVKAMRENRVSFDRAERISKRMDEILNGGAVVENI